MKEYWFIIVLFLLLIGYSYLLISFAFWLFCLAFGVSFSWLKAFWFWLGLSLLAGGIKIKIKK